MVVNAHRVRINDFGNCTDNVTTGPDFGEHIFVANLNFLTVTCKCFHNFSELGNVKTNFQSPAQLAYANILHTIKRTVQKAVAQFDVINHFEKAGNTHKRINLFAIEQAGNLDFVIAVDFAGSVF